MSHLIGLLALLLPPATLQSGPSETFEQAFDRGNAAFASGRLEEAIGAFSKCLELRPNDPGAAVFLAYGHSRKGEIDDALCWLERSIEWGMPLREWLQTTYLDPLRNEPRFRRLVDEAGERMMMQALPPPAYIDWTGGHRTSATVARFSPDGSRILTSSNDLCARIWDSDSGELLLLIPGTEGPHGIWKDAGRQVLTKGLCSWDALTGDLLRVLPLFSTAPHDLSPDSSLILCPNGNGATLVDFNTGRRLEVVNGSSSYGVAFSPDGARFATAGADGRTRLFEVVSCECLATHDCGVAVFDVTFSPDARWLVTAGADGLVRWLHPQSLELVRSFRAHEAEVNSVVFRPDGVELLTTGVDRTAKIWSVEDASLRRTLRGHEEEVVWADWSPDGTRIVTPSDDGTVREWDARTGELLLTLGGRGSIQRSVAFTPDGTRLVTFDAGGLRQWDIATGAELAPSSGSMLVRVKNGRGGIPSAIVTQQVAWDGKPPRIEIDGGGVRVDAAIVSPTLHRVYTTDQDDHGRLWDARSGHLVRDLGLLSGDGDLTRAGSRWASACFSPDGALLATAQHKDGRAHLWLAENGDEVDRFPGDGAWVSAVAFDPSGERLAVAQADKDIEVWDLGAHQRVCSFIAFDNWVTQMTFDQSGKALLAGYNGIGLVRMWEVSTGRCVRVFQVPLPTTIKSVALSPDGKRIAAATRDHRVVLWDVEGGRLLGTIVPGEEPGDWLAFAPSAHYCGTPASIARARLVQGAISYPLTCFAAMLESPEQVCASFTGVKVELPKLPIPPTLVVARPVERASSTAERFAHIEALATEPLAGLADIDVVQDGVSVPAEVITQALTLVNNRRLGRFDLRLPIPAGANETRITLQAVSARGIKSRPETFVVRYEPPRRELYVLALGVAHYADNSLDLAYPVQDVDGLIAQLEGQKDELFNEVHIERRVDREVATAEVLRLREEFLLRARPDDTIVVFVAGHGVRSDTGEYWFLTSDATPARPFGGVQRSTLESLVTWDKLHATKRVLLLDTCHSGSAFGQSSRGERGIAFQQSEVDTLLERSSGLYILAATSDDGFAREQEGNGLFTRALLDGLEGAADSGDFGDKDGTVGIDELMHFARYAVLERSAGRQRPTFPKIEGGENFPLARVGSSEEER